MNLECLRLAGTPNALGRGHGQRYADDIRRFAAERVAHAGDALWIGVDASREDVLALADDCLDAHADYAPHHVEELSALAAVAGLTTAEALIVSGFTDFLDTAYRAFGGQASASSAADNCTAMLIPPARSANGHGLFAQTWDMHETATEHVVIYQAKPENAPAFTTFTSRGCLGMIGMNDHGITVGINNLSGADGQVGVTWNVVVREILAQRSFDAAMDVLARAPLAGAHNYLVLGPDGRGANIEATATQRVVTPLADTPLVHTNHCLSEATAACERERLPASQRDSTNRYTRAHALLAARSQLEIDDLAAITRDTQAICYPPTPKLRMTTCGAVLADPAARRLWALRGRPSEQTYTVFDVG